MKRRSASILLIILVGVIGLSLAGCAAGPTTAAPAKTRPEMLREAGFKAYVADTPQKIAHLKTCPGETLMVQERQGAKCYAFSDTASQTMYIGDEAAYWRFKGLLEKQEEKVIEQRIESDPEFWTNWGHAFGGN